MKIDKVIHSVDDNLFYQEFWPIVSKVWKVGFNIEPVLIHVSSGKTEIESEYGTVHKIDEVEGVPIHTQSQMARLWYTKTEPDTVWMTSDIDMIPASRKYFKEQDNNLDLECFTNLTTEGDYFPICYNIAKGKVFEKILKLDCSFETFLNNVKEFFNMENWDDEILDGIHTVNSETFQNWSLDEKYLSRLAVKYRESGGCVNQPERIGGIRERRLCRSFWMYNINDVIQEKYIDSHLLRPYSEYKNEIDFLVENILEGVL